VLDNSQSLVIGGLEFLESVTQLIIVVARASREAGFVFGGSIGDVEIHGQISIGG
jgi:hypothetical protein